ncbi:MAG: S8 family peptidase [Oscillospiraceae bacterium]|nr:S8 family peptidase [Oscillospiraceae bacterium]
MDIREQLIRQFQGFDPEQNIEVIIKYHGSLDEIAEKLEASAEELNENYAILTLPAYRIPTIIQLSQIEYYELPKTVTYQLERSLDAACISPVQLESGYNLSGKGVFIGIIDSGIDYTHPDFRQPDGTSRIMYLWDQTAADISPPSGFKNGHLYTKADIDLALASDNPLSIVPEQDFFGHGTAVAGVAAGNGRASNGDNIGVAPQAEIIIVKLGSDKPGFAKSTEIMRGVKFCIDIAQGVEKPIAINISYGTNDGAHNGTSLFEGYLDSAAQRWKNVICVASGNEGSAGHHYHNQLKQLQTDNVEFSIGENISQLYMTLWKNFADSFQIELFTPSGISTGVINAFERVKQVTLGNVKIMILYGQPNHYNFNQEIYISLQSVSGSMNQEIWRLAITGTKIVDGNFDIWLPMTDMVTEKTAFLVPSIENTITLPATSFRVIAVGGYSAILNTCAEFSGRGTGYWTYGQKPDLVAPAIDITTAAVGGGYDSFSGTSIAAPFVTGAAALMMEWGENQKNDFFLYGQRIKAFLCRNAERKFPIKYPNPIWGYGTLNLCDTMDDLVLYNQ